MHEDSISDDTGDINVIDIIDIIDIKKKKKDFMAIRAELRKCADPVEVAATIERLRHETGQTKTTLQKCWREIEREKKDRLKEIRNPQGQQKNLSQFDINSNHETIATDDTWPRLTANDKPPHITTDQANGYRIAHDIGRDLLYVVNISWYAWDETHWRRGEELAYRKAQLLSRIILAEAATNAKKSSLADDPQKRRDLISITESLVDWAKKSESRDKIYSAMALAKPMLAVDSKNLDCDNWSLNCTNGVLDLRTAELRAHRRDDFITRCMPVPYDPSSVCPKWLEFLDRIFAGNTNVIAFVQKAIGYALTGDISEQCVFFLHGNGQNGKSTMLSTIQELMGAYAQQAAPDLLLAGKHDRHPTELAELRGTRLITSVETGENRRLNENLVKQMSGGDRMKARFMKQDFFEFVPTHKVCLATNHRPIIRGTDHAIWRRIRLIPFNVTIPPEERDRTLPEKLKLELPGILAWAVQGCLDWQREGLNPPQEVVAATQTYQTDMDILITFFDEYCVIDKSLSVSKKEIYNEYKAWCENSGERAATQRTFSGWMQERGFGEYKTTGGLRIWQGIGLGKVAQVAQGGAKSGITGTCDSARIGHRGNSATCATNATNCKNCNSYTYLAKTCGYYGQHVPNPDNPICNGHQFTEKS